MRVMGFIAAPEIAVTTIAYLHVISAIGWLGGAFLFATAIAPGVRRMSPTASLEFLSNVVPRATNYFLLFATSTVIFGPALLLTIPDESPLIYVGASTALTAYVVALLTVRLFKRAVGMAKEMLKGTQPGPSPAELQRTLKNGGIGVTVIVILLVTTLLFMIYSGYPF